MKSNRFSAVKFSQVGEGFCPLTYSRMKFGCDQSARTLGHELANVFFDEHSDLILANKIIVTPSPYNYVKNAATIMTEHFINRLNHFSVNAGGKHVEYSTVNRKVSYINDYGFLSKEKRRGLIDNDEFYLPSGLYKDKLLLFVDDVTISGTHEEKLQEILEENGVDNERMFLYYGEYVGDNPAIEAEINFAAIKNVDDYLKIANNIHSQFIVRSLKYLLGLDEVELNYALNNLLPRQISQIYYGCLAEGYYRIPAYQTNFQKIKSKLGLT